MPSVALSPKKNRLRIHLTPQERLERWIKKHATPPPTIEKRPLLMQLPKKVREANSFATSDVWLTACGELHLGGPRGPHIGTIAQ